MHPLPAQRVVEIWEQGRALNPVDRALLVLGFACPERTRDELAALTIGERDACLLEFRAQTLDSALAAFCECASCGERLELTFKTDELMIRPRPERPAPCEFFFGEYVVRFRLPNSKDLAAAAAFRNSSRARQHLIERCVDEVRCNGAPADLASLPENFPEQLSTRMAECDPQADVQLAIRCPNCQAESEFTFDISSFFWAEVTAFAKRLLREVHVLARAYGWSEAEILSLSPPRRQCYLEMVGS